MPDSTGITFVVMQHLTEGQESLLPKLIQKHTMLNVLVIRDQLEISAGLVYVLPPDYNVEIRGDTFHLTPIQNPQGWPKTFDIFLKSLATAYRSKAGALIFSGMGSDGVKGAQAVNRVGGLVITQDAKSADHADMPENVNDAISTDIMLEPGEMPLALLNYFDIDTRKLIGREHLSETLSEDEIDQINRRLRRLTGRDFYEYKHSTLRRQVARRMGIHQFEAAEDYIAFMEDHPQEAEQLGRQLLINVTSFFRDREAFAALKTMGLMPMLREFDIDEPFRVWVPGCATGEEAISIAILIYECLQSLDKAQLEVRIFATDANPESLETARAGIYSRIAVADLTPKRLAAHFIETEHGYRLRNHISRMMIWSDHNLIEHPPFSNLQLISCRNLLIYFQPRLQIRVIALFQFALREGGLLFLGSSETVPMEASAFTRLDGKHRLYQRLAADRASWLQLEKPLFMRLPDEDMDTPMADNTPPERGTVDRELKVVEQMLLTHYDSTCVIVDENYRVRYTYGEIDRYLRVLPGKEGRNGILEMAREELDTELTLALHQALETGEPIMRRDVWLKTNGDERIIDLVILPIPEEKLRGRRWLLIFKLIMAGQELREPSAARGSTDDDEGNVGELQAELRETKQKLQSVTQALQTKSEELTSSMEEIRSANEEVQTTNEELRTSKEELESMNEELNTLNTQLTSQNEALTRANNTLHNFLQSTEIGTIFLDQKLAVREFTSAVTEVFSLREDDEGRPLEEIANRLNYEALTDDCSFVLDTLNNVENEIQTRGGNRWYSVKIRPYRTINNVIDGLVLTFADITAQKQAHFLSEAQTAYVRKIFDTIGHSLLELDNNLRVLSANQVFYQTFRTSEEETIERRLYELGNGQWDIPELRRLLSEVIPSQAVVRDYTVRHNFPQLGKSTMRLNARQIAELDRILLVITQVSSSGS